MTKHAKIKYFEDRVNHYFFEVFKMYDFELTIHDQKKFGTRASTYWHPIEDGAGMITICYSNYWIESKNTNKHDIDIVAFHEVWEAILSELQELVKRRYISEKDLPNAVHRVIRRMENIMFPLVKDKIKNKI
jgi:hypothetical protein